MRIHVIRHATMVIYVSGKKIIVDPMLSQAGALPAVPGSANDRPNPLVELPCPVEELLEADAVLLTHSHRDHFDAAAEGLLPRDIPFFCQPEDVERLQQQGFRQVSGVDSRLEWAGIEITRTGGSHGTGEIGARMGPVSGYVLRSAAEPSLYIAGDTVWCGPVEDALALHRPAVTVLFAGGARFLQGDPITMAEQDVAAVCRALPETRVVAVHMEAWNHCLLTREALRQSLAAQGQLEQVSIPANGEWLSFS